MAEISWTTPLLTWKENFSFTHLVDVLPEKNKYGDWVGILFVVKLGLDFILFKISFSRILYMDTI